MVKLVTLFFFNFLGKWSLLFLSFLGRILKRYCLWCPPIVVGFFFWLFLYTAILKLTTPIITLLICADIKLPVMLLFVYNQYYKFVNLRIPLLISLLICPDITTSQPAQQDHKTIFEAVLLGANLDQNSHGVVSTFQNIYYILQHR